ncbi:MAG: FAD/NAD(P)-binding oxidoreductase [Pseudomonadota bacterium]|nr:FAD/NAD(P)-binding oxidoreductase [Pseudomonadota bacterium]
MKNLVILGAGTAGTMMAARLSRELAPDGWRITLVDRDDDHVYQPGLLFVPFGMYAADDIVRRRRRYCPAGVTLDLAGLDRVEPDTRTVRLADGRSLSYDVLIVATGTEVDPAATEGLTGHGWRQTASDFYTLDGAKALAKALDGFTGGRLLLNVVEMPIKCPVAPLEFLFLADAYFTERKIRDRVEIVYATPLDGAFTKPRASQALGGMLTERKIAVEADFAAAKVDGEARKLVGFDGRELDYDLLVTIPLHKGSDAIARSGMGDTAGFVPTHKHTLQTLAHPEVFALGDCTNLPASKAGAVAHFQSEVLVENVLRFIAQRELLPAFDGHANCFIETGHGKAMLIDFNYDTEPLPGRFPLPGVGPFTLLEESYVNHWGKLGFRWVYWNLLLRGEDLPLDHRMAMAGKWS